MKSTIGIGIGALILGAVLGYWAMPRDFSGPMEGSFMGGRSMENAAIDRHFIEQMIPHHEGAIAMAELALERSERPEIRSLANSIVEDQSRENALMRTWYREWFGGEPEAGMQGQGMMSMHSMGEDLDSLRDASDFDQEFLRQMIPHHEAAVMMAQMLAAGSRRPEMQELADQIIASQTREIEMMRGWLNEWSAQ